ncbi:hypothetical protein Moror_11890 [Moniliophthora roreri MCA 2997]|uniref:Uncharacterized protein n=1 Tax=Moniliophthora roreri (strain MCA 2997) TaxID=1381753 RepID=V2Y647_MONRO|nr:hypothetical protein Moror_11890 [Moniliophthora roreri MCA 2997]KAI3595115.1 hypothetical protein WG66_011235 [Moniliophthora roreri]
MFIPPASASVSPSSLIKRPPPLPPPASRSSGPSPSPTLAPSSSILPLPRPVPIPHVRDEAAGGAEMTPSSSVSALRSKIMNTPLLLENPSFHLV